MSTPAASVGTAYPSAAVQVRLVVLMTALSAMSYFNRTIMSISGPGIMKEFQISEPSMGTVYSAFLLSYTLCMGLGGALADRFGARRTLFVAGLCASAFTALTSWCGPAGLGAYFGVTAAFIAVRFLFGVATAPLYPSTARISADRIPPASQSSVQSIVMAGAAVGAAISPVLFTRLIGSLGWRSAFVLAAITTLLLLFVWLFAVPKDAPRRHRQPDKASGWGRLLANRDLLMLTAGYFMLNYFEYIFFYWIYYYFGEIRKMGPEMGALATTAMFVAMATMSPLGGWLADHAGRRIGKRKGRQLVSMSGMALSAVLLFLGARGAGVTATVVLLALALGCCTMAEGPFWATAIDIGGDQAGASGGIMNTGGNVGGMLAPVVTPLIAARFGWAGGLYFASFLVLIGVFTWLWVNPERDAEPV
ncbi:MAG: MFS transporter [Bryobacteraceae bacterium]